jgi:hypothetical protein
VFSNLAEPDGGDAAQSRAAHPAGWSARR